MRIDISPYVLEPLPGFLKSSRQGALLKVTFEEGITGYADFHPWPELGDLPLFQHLRQQDTPLFQRSLHYARVDAEARKQGIWLFQYLTCPSSHLLLPHTHTQKYLEDGLQQCFTRFKMKVGRDFAIEQQVLIKLLPILYKNNAKIRLDFNETLSKQEYEDFFKDLLPWKDCIDFCEDPFKYNENDWELSQSKQGIDFACDFASTPDQKVPNVRVIKPAKQDPTPFVKSIHGRLVITSYLDHPLGQLCAAYDAAQSKKRLDVCGLLSHLVYKKNPFSEKLTYTNTILSPPPGLGFGFDEELRHIPWIRL